MMFGGRKFKKWKEENPGEIRNLYLQSSGDAKVMEDLLNNETEEECRKQIRDFMLKAHDLGYFFKGTEELENEIRRRRQQEMLRQQQEMLRQQQFRQQQESLRRQQGFT